MLPLQIFFMETLNDYEATVCGGALNMWSYIKGVCRLYNDYTVGTGSFQPVMCLKHDFDHPLHLGPRLKKE